MEPCNQDLRKKAKRQRVHVLRVPVLPSEKDQITENARRAGLGIAAYLRAVSIGYEIKSRLDLNVVKELAKVNADQGRLGGLLKMALTNEEIFDGFGGAELKIRLYELVEEISKYQHELKDKTKAITKSV